MINLKTYLFVMCIMFSTLITGCNSGAETASDNLSTYKEMILDYDESSPLQLRKISSSSSMAQYDEQWVTITIFNNTNEEVYASSSLNGGINSVEIFNTTSQQILSDGSFPLLWFWSHWIPSENSFDFIRMNIAPKQSGVMLVVINRGIYLDNSLELRASFKGKQSNTIYNLKQLII